jgi:uncharacterized protein YndB with AHSA1/START domain
VTLVVSEVDIARPPEEVFSYVTDPSLFGEWQSGVVSGHMEDAGPHSVGSKCVVTRRIGGSDRTSTSELTQLAAPRTWAIHGIDGPVRADVTITVDPVNDGLESHVTIELDLHGHGVGKMLMPVVLQEARKEAPLSCEKLKELLETVSGQ